jgi:CheY-like chemotaxis protein
VSSGQFGRDQYHSQAALEPINELKKQPVVSTAVDLVDVAREAENDDDTTVLLTSCLLVDSIESNRTFMRRLLTRRGVSTVHCVSSGEEALNLFRELSQSERNDVQVCFIEYEMPIQNGSELTARLRAEPLCITCPIIGITGSGLEESRRMFQTAGASAIITAPIRTDMLAYTLRHFNLIFVE